MGRPRRPLNAVADATDVRTRLKSRGLEPWQVQRLRAVQLGFEGSRPLEEIAQISGVSQRSIGEWFERFRSGGIEKLLNRQPKGKGPASWLDARTARDFQTQLAKGHWHKAEEARVWLQNKLRRPLSLVVVYKYLGKLATRRNGALVPKSPPPAKAAKAGKPAKPGRRELARR